MSPDNQNRRSYDQLVNEIDGLRQELRSLTNNVSDLLIAWQTANGVLRFVKMISKTIGWFSGLILSFGVIWATATGKWK